MLFHIGNDNYVSAESLIAIVDFRTSPVKRLIRKIQKEHPHRVIDVTRNRSAESLIILKSGIFIISPFKRKTLALRFGIGNEV